MSRAKVIRIRDAPPGDARNIGIPASRLAILAQAGVGVPDGFIVTQEFLESVIGAEAKERMRALGKGAKSAGTADRAALHEEASRTLSDGVIPWELEMELAKALQPMPQGAWLAPSREDGGTPVFAPVRSKNALVERVREIWSTAIGAESPEGWHEPFSPIVAFAARDYEASGLAEMSADGRGHVSVEAAFGLPQALSDRKVSRDRYSWSLAESRQTKADVVRQRWQYTVSERGVSRVDVAPALAEERKLSEDSLAGLASAVKDAAEALDGLPAVVWGIAGDVCEILWVLDLKPWEHPPKLPVQASPPAAHARTQAHEALPVTATRLMIYGEAGTQPGITPEIAGVFPLEIGGWVKGNILAHPGSPEGLSMEQVRTGLAAALETSAKAAGPRQVVASLSSLTSQEFAGMPGGDKLEPSESNPLLGFRGGARHLSAGHGKLLEAELSAVALARQSGARNLSLSLPFVRTTDELSALAARARSAGLERGQDFKLWMSVDVPSNVLQAREFAALCDGLAVRLEPLYHLLSAVDPGSKYLADAGFARPADEGVRRAVSEVIVRARETGKPVVLCGERLHEASEVLETAVREGVDAVSTRPEHIHQLARAVAAVEQRILLEGAARLRGGGVA